MKDAGQIVTSLGTIRLLPGTAHLLPWEEAEPHIREGVLQQVCSVFS